MKKISFSEFSTWLNCPLQWKFKYIDRRFPFEQNIHSIFGTAVHRVIQDWLKDMVYGGKSKIYCRTIDLSDDFKQVFIEEAAPHITQTDDEGNIVYTFTRHEMEEFYHQGMEIIKYIQSNYEKIFPTEDVKLFAIEYELNVEINEHVRFKGYIDIVTQDIKTGKYVLYDLKTSTRGWNKYTKKDKKKTDQLLFYKLFFAKERNIPLNMVDISYVILKRIVPDMEFHVPRISEFIPSHGKVSVNKAQKKLNNFLDLVFSPEGDYISEQVATPSENACKFCPFDSDGSCDMSWYRTKNTKVEEQWITLKT